MRSTRDSVVVCIKRLPIYVHSVIDDDFLPSRFEIWSEILADLLHSVRLSNGPF